MAEDLASMKCEPCRGGIPALQGERLAALHAQLLGWDVMHEHHLEKTFSFLSFKDAVAFAVKVAMLAEENGHHPVMEISFKKVKVQYWTHKIDGLHEADFIMAAKTDRIS